MKKPLFLIILLCYPSLFLFAQNSGQVYYALPEGYPYREMNFQSELEEGVILKFGDQLDVIQRYNVNPEIWYYLSKDGLGFYLPYAFVVKRSQGIAYDEKGNIIIGREEVDRNHSLPLSYKPNDLVPVPPEYIANGYESRELMLREEANAAFISIIEDAEKDGITIRVISTYRDAWYQSYLYLNALEKHGLLQTVVAKPGHSEHQLGTTCDLTSYEIENELSLKFAYTNAFQWLLSQADRYGISLSYPLHKGRVTGYSYEPWHFRYWGKNRWENYFKRYGIFLTR